MVTLSRGPLLLPQGASSKTNGGEGGGGGVSPHPPPPAVRAMAALPAAPQARGVRAEQGGHAGGWCGCGAAWARCVSTYTCAEGEAGAGVAGGVCVWEGRL